MFRIQIQWIRLSAQYAYVAGFSFEAGGRTYRPVRYFDTNIWEFSYFLFFYLSELQPCLRNAGNDVSECSGHTPRPPSCLRLRRSQGALRRQDKFYVRCFLNHVRYFTKLLKTLYVVLLQTIYSYSG